MTKRDRYVLRLGANAQTLVEVEILDGWDVQEHGDDAFWDDHDPAVVQRLHDLIETEWQTKTTSIRLSLTHEEAEALASLLTTEANTQDDIAEETREWGRKLRDAATGLATQVYKQMAKFR